MSDALDKQVRTMSEAAEVARARMRAAAVIAGLRERGWPEPYQGEGVFDWSAPDIGWLSWCPYESAVTCGTVDGQESWCVDLDEGVPTSRVIATIDRLHWVIGLPELRVKFSTTPQGPCDYLVPLGLHEKIQAGGLSDNLPGAQYEAETIEAMHGQHRGMYGRSPGEPPPSDEFLLLHGNPDWKCPDCGESAHGVLPCLRPLPVRPADPQPGPYEPHKWGDHG